MYVFDKGGIIPGLVMILCHCCHGRGWHLLLPQKLAANNEVQTAGCGVRPPRVTGRTIPLTPPTWLPCVSLGVGDYERACQQSAFQILSWVFG